MSSKEPIGNCIYCCEQFMIKIAWSYSSYAQSRTRTVVCMFTVTSSITICTFSSTGACFICSLRFATADRSRSRVALKTKKYILLRNAVGCFLVFFGVLPNFQESFLNSTETENSTKNVVYFFEKMQRGEERKITHLL